MEYVIFALILLITNALLLAGAGILVRKKLQDVRSEAVQLVTSFITPPAEGQPSQLGIYADSIAQIFASRLMQSARAQLSNMASINSRQNAKLAAGEVASGLPGGLGMIPGVDKMIQKNPLVGLALQALGPKLFGGSSGPSQEKATPAASPGNGSGNVFTI